MDAGGTFPDRADMDDATLERPRLLYFADTMCSWCYGFAPQMGAVLKALGDRVDLLLFSGGLRPFTTAPIDDQTRAYLGKTWARIADVTGQPFKSGATDRAGFVYDTEPASRAVVTVRALAAGHAYGYMHRIQRAFYAEGDDVTDAAVLARHAETDGIDRDRFMAAFAGAAMREATLDDFRVAQRLGIDGFPTLVLHRTGADGAGELVLISKGYDRAAAILERIEAALMQASRNA